LAGVINARHSKYGSKEKSGKLNPAQRFFYTIFELTHKEIASVIAEIGDLYSPYYDGREAPKRLGIGDYLYRYARATMKMSRMHARMFLRWLKAYGITRWIKPGIHTIPRTITELMSESWLCKTQELNTDTIADYVEISATNPGKKVVYDPTMGEEFYNDGPRG
jgi:hypothetical protein